MPGLHEALTPISWLSGRWTSTNGKGSYSRIDDFSYHDEMEFICIGQPMFNFSSSSRHPETSKPMHQERGFLRIKPGTNELAFAVSHNFGISSMELGASDLEKKEIVLESNNLLRAQDSDNPHWYLSAGQVKPIVKKFRRVLRLIAPDKLEVTLEMETDQTPLTLHLQATYSKVSEN